MLPQTVKIMKKLREINRSIDNALKINEFVDSYIEECILNNQPATLITPWSLSRSFTKRHVDQGNIFIPTKNEERLFRKEITVIINTFQENNLTLNWWIIFSRSYIRTKSISEELEKEYIAMIANLIEINKLEIAIVNWEDDVINMNHKPNTDLFLEENFSKMIRQKDFEYELSRRKDRAESILLLSVPNEELIKETKFKIACEAEEGRFLMESNKNPLCESGKFLFLILGRAERYHFFSTLTPEFEKRILCILKPYPWRLQQSSVP